MGAITFSIDVSLIEHLAHITQIDTFVETGTYRGDTVATVLPYFRRIISIEREEELHRAASVRFVDKPVVTLLQGDSAQVLDNLREELQARKVLFWLDAHWRLDGDLKQESYPCPLLAELQAIHKLNQHSVVLIDDARLFLSPPAGPHDAAQWPRLQEIVLALQSLSLEHRLLVLNDVIIFYPPGLEEKLYAFAHEHGVDWLKLAQQNKEYECVLQDNLAKEAEIQRLIQVVNQQQIELGQMQATFDQQQIVFHQALRDRRLSPLYWARRLVVPFRHRAQWAYHKAKQLWLHSVHRGKTLSQYPPVPMRIPAHYYQVSLPMEELPMVSLVTPSYNQGRYLSRTIDSVLAQRYPNLEYVVQDGGSTDNTLAVLEQYGSRVTRVVSMLDQGQADAINRGFQQTQGEIMAWLNSDDILLPGTIAYVVKFFQSHPEVDVIYGHRIIIDENDLEIGRWVLPEHDGHVLAWADFVPQETLFWRRRLWDKVGACVDTTYQFAIDWELLLRFQRAGATFVRLPRFLAAFRVHDQQKTSAFLETTGNQEMARLRTAYHGRPVSSTEVHYHISRYLIRAAWLDRLVAWGIVRH